MNDNNFIMLAAIFLVVLLGVCAVSLLKIAQYLKAILEVLAG